MKLIPRRQQTLADRVRSTQAKLKKQSGGAIDLRLNYAIEQLITAAEKQASTDGGAL